MKEIASHHNKSVKQIKKLKEKKQRDTLGMYVIEGKNLLKDAVKNGEEIILIGIDGARSIPKNLIPDVIPDDLEKKVVCFSSDIYRMLTDTVTPQEILAVVKKRKKKLTGGKNRFIILDELQDPGNVGTIIRTAEAAGFTGVLAVKGTTDMYSPKVVRAAAGSVFRMGISEFDTKEEVLDFLKKKNVVLFACDSNGHKIYDHVDLKENIGIVVGNEGNGLSRFFAEKSIMIRIPMEKEAESLNVAIAAGIIMFESARQNKSQHEV